MEREIVFDKSNYMEYTMKNHQMVIEKIKRVLVKKVNNMAIPVKFICMYLYIKRCQLYTYYLIQRIDMHPLRTAKWIDHIRMKISDDS